jgi:DNA-binding MurR/RpiR family transcriptional regulator
MIENIQDYLSTLQLTMNQLSRQQIADVIDRLPQAKRKGNPAFILGIGGSALKAPNLPVTF